MVVGDFFSLLSTKAPPFATVARLHRHYHLSRSLLYTPRMRLGIGGQPSERYRRTVDIWVDLDPMSPYLTIRKHGGVVSGERLINDGSSDFLKHLRLSAAASAAGNISEEGSGNFSFVTVSTRYRRSV